MKKTRLLRAPALVGVIASSVALVSEPAMADKLSKCITIDKPGSYVVTRNLIADGDCLVVAADFVTIDLGGWLIDGDGSDGSGVTDQDAPRQGIAVRNGTITGFTFAISLGSTTGAVIEKVRASRSVDSITVGLASIVRGNIATAFEAGLEAGPGSTISDNTVRGNPGIVARRASTVSGNTVVGDDFGAIVAGPGSTISGNTASAFLGIVAAPGSTVSGNTAIAREEQEGGSIGIQVNCPSNVIGNTATGHSNNLVLAGAGCTNIDNLAP